MTEIKNIIDKTLNGKGDSDKHLMLLYSLVIGSNSTSIIELGVRNGDTTLPLVLAAKETGGFVHSVDKYETTLVLDEYLKKYNRFYKQDAVQFLENWDSTKKIDIILIDDWHSYDHVKRELEILDKLVSSKTIILLHDLMYGNSCPMYHTDLTLKDGQWANGGPYRAVAELNNQFWEFSTLPWNNGMTILRKKYSSKYQIL
jgi:predicted O-methyltransferase YrrM